jgi:hypothetical protein
MATSELPTGEGSSATVGKEEAVRVAVEAELKRIGWKDGSLRREWSVPDTPHDLTKRDRGLDYKRCGRADLAAFDGEDHQPHNLKVLFEFKEPTIDKGRTQLVRYLASEPMVRMGYWTNRTQSLAIYKSHTNEWIEIPDAPLPQPGDDLTAPPTSPPTWKDLAEPEQPQLASALKRMIARVVAEDHRSTRREYQLRQILNILLVKVESDAIASAPGNQDDPVAFRIYGDKQSMVHVTADVIRQQFAAYYAQQGHRVFSDEDDGEIHLNDETIFAVVDALWPWRILGDSVELLSKAFQIFRTQALKSGEGQFLTPHRVIRPCVMALDITSRDKVIDPACGTGGFLVEALRQVQEREFRTDTWRLVKYANDKLYGVDLDSLGVKLTKAMMIAMQDGSTHVLRGDAIRQHLWRKPEFAELQQSLGGKSSGSVAESFTVVVTNPPFGEDLKVSASDCRTDHYTISQAAARASRNSKKDYVDLEIGLVYLELAYRLLQTGGRVGIVLPETYFFSHKYRWLPGWLEGRLKLRGMLNIPMEAFEEFCRAKTNFYIFEKVGHGPAGKEQS